MKKKFFKNYLLGYLNTYFTVKYVAGKDNFTYKNYKINKTISYLNLSPVFAFFFRKSSFFISFLESYISVFILIILFFKRLFFFARTSFIEVKSRNIVFGISDKFYLDKFISHIGISKEQFYLLCFPNSNSGNLDIQKVSVLSGIKFRDLVYSFIYSLQIIFFIKKKYSHRDLFFGAHASFDFFLTSFYIYNSSISNKYYSDATYCKWAHLLGGLSHETYLVQHGIVFDNVRLFKIGSVNNLIYLNDQQKSVFEHLILINIPISKNIQKATKFDSLKTIKNGLYNVLLICNNIYFDREKSIINDLSKLNLNLYVKPHPTDSPEKYVNECINKKFVLLGKEDFPIVDIVISYNSTLAIEYKSNGIEVLFYDDLNYHRNYDNLLKKFTN
jgi:hypothetical protein